MEKIANASCGGYGYQIYAHDGQFVVYRNDALGEEPIGRADDIEEVKDLIRSDAGDDRIRIESLDD